MSQLDPAAAKEHAKNCLNFVRSVSDRVQFNSATDEEGSLIRYLAYALDNLEEASAMLLNLSERVKEGA